MGKFLDQINSPSDLKKLSNSALESLASEIREEIISVISKNGGHLAPNLGVVELTLALHAVLSSPKDKIIWDVGHQSYVHKLLTGRKDVFATIRQYEGISGFPKRSESEHDIFDTGHSSTSISSALGIAKARDMKGEDFNVVAVIGDGSLTGGMAFEALNHAGHLKTNLIVVLNDNEMSIAPNVGALASYLYRLRVDPTLQKVQKDVEYLLRKIPAIGSTMVKTIERVKDSLKYLLVRGILFEEMGFTYLGPIDGHNIQVLKNVIQDAKSLSGPVLVHVVTKKGYGYKPAENCPDRFHGIAPFEVKTGETISKKEKPTYTDVFGSTLVDLAAKDKSIVGITAAMPDGTGLKKFADNFPERFFDVGIAEQHAVTFAAGLATQGFKPVVAIYSTFMQRAYDQIVHDVCLQKLPVVFALDRAGLVGDDGPTHHGVFDFSYLRNIPNMVLMAPKDENELKQMLGTALAYSGPAAIRYPRGEAVGVECEQDAKTLPIGKAEIIQEGNDLLIIAIGSMVYPALEAAEKLRSEKINVTVVNARFVKPLDEDAILELAGRIGKVLTVEEHVISGGFGSAILELFERTKQFPNKVVNLGLPDKFVQHGNNTILLEKYKLTAEGIYQTALGML